MPEYKIKIFGADWCGDCRRAKSFLNEHGVDFSFINIDKDRVGEQFVLDVNRGMRSIPTIIFDDGSILVEPSDLELSKKLGIRIPDSYYL